MYHDFFVEKPLHVGQANKAPMGTIIVHIVDVAPFFRVSDCATSFHPSTPACTHFRIHPALVEHAAVGLEAGRRSASALGGAVFRLVAV